MLERLPSAYTASVAANHALLHCRMPDVSVTKKESTYVWWSILAAHAACLRISLSASLAKRPSAQKAATYKNSWHRYAAYRKASIYTSIIKPANFVDKKLGVYIY